MLIGEKVNLVAAERSYVPYYTKWINDPEVTRWLKADPPFSVEMEEDWIEGVRQEGKMTFTILTKDGKPIGNMGVEEICWKARRATLGIMIGEKDHWNKGFGSDAITTVLRYLFEELGMRRVQLFTDLDNLRAQKAYKKCGFREEGVMRQYRTKDGLPVDEMFLAILADDWFATHPRKM